MKKVMFVGIICVYALKLNAQDNEKVVASKDSVVTEQKGDTTIVWIGKKAVQIVDSNGNTSVSVKNMDDGQNKNTIADDSTNKYGDYDNIDKRINEKIDKKIGKKFWDRDEHFEPHWGGFAMGFNSLLSSNRSSTLPSSSKFMENVPEKSLDVQLNLWEIGLPVAHHIGFVSGIGLDWTNYRFKNNNNMMKDDNGYIVTSPAPDGVKYDKSKFQVTYLTIPLLFELQKNIAGHTAYVNFGINGKLKLGSHTRVYYTQDGDDKRQTIKNDFNINAFSYDATARVGYRFINLYVNYSLVSLFDKNQGPEVYPLSVGLTLINF
jgi:hypothetical protein